MTQGPTLISSLTRTVAVIALRPFSSMNFASGVASTLYFVSFQRRRPWKGKTPSPWSTMSHFGSDPKSAGARG